MTVTAGRPPATGRLGPPGRDLALLTVAVAAVSTSGPLIAVTAVPALAIAFWRNALASAVLAPVVVLRRRQELRGLLRRERRLAALAGVLLALHFAVWIPSIRFTSVASATGLVATQPVWAALISRARGEEVRRLAWVGIGIALAGALLLTGADLQLSTRALVGDAMALLGGVFAAGYVTAGGEVRRSVSSTTYTALCYTVTSAVLLVLCVADRDRLAGWPAGEWLKLAALTAGAQLLGHSLFSVVLRTMSPTAVSMSILFEIPGAALIAAAFVRGQHLSLLALPAGVLLLTGLALVIRAGSGTAEPAVPVE